MNAIEARHLSKQFDKPQGWRRLARMTPVTAVSDLSLAIPEGELFGLLGPNGAGKTTLVKMLCTLILPSSGGVTVAGHDLAEAGAIRAAVGLVVSDDRSFYWRLSARRNLVFFAAMHGLYGRAAAERIDQVLADVDLLDVADRRFGQFSSGMKQRLAVARSLLHRPRILFLDEPSRSLDPTATHRLHTLIRRLMAEQEMTIFLITHDLAEAEALCDRVAFMHRGRFGPPVPRTACAAIFGRCATVCTSIRCRNKCWLSCATSPTSFTILTPSRIKLNCGRWLGMVC
ncbi:MAG: ABC transporter ATP-binding protein [Anaerolineae bacterium]